MNLAVRWDLEALDTLRDLGRRNRDQARRIRRRVAAFAQTGHGDVRKLEGTGDRWRLRTGDWRVIFVFDPPGTITVLTVALRRDAYRD